MATDRAIELLTDELRSLTVRTQQVETELRELRGQVVDTAQQGPAFARGDRVRITNRVRRQANWTARWDNKAIETERRATVTHRVKDQVWLTTDNGTRTWRAPNNLRRAQDE